MKVHESHFVFDILFNNNTDIEPEIHSTDTHGTNEVNFALLHVFGYQFAPRYKDLCDKTRTSLTGFRHPSRYGDAILRPARKIREKDIIREWDECRRIFVSLARKETTQSTIVRKLSSHARNNRTKRALWEYDSIHRSLRTPDTVELGWSQRGENEPQFGAWKEGLRGREFLAEMNQHGIVRPQSVDSPESTQSTTYGPSGY